MFLNLALAGGLAAIGAPILIHLLHRRRIQRLDWGAMLFLQELLHRARRRLFIEQWLLLLVRVLVLACLALALMRPARTPRSVEQGGSAVIRRGRVAAVLLLDDSFSCGAGRPRARVEAMRSLVGAYLDSLRDGDEVSVVRLSGLREPVTDPFYDLDAARALVRSLEPTGMESDVPRLLERGLLQLTRHLNPEAELVLVTDGCAGGWHAHDRGRWVRLRDRLAPAGSRHARVIVLQPSRQQPLVNAAVTAVVVGRSLVPAGRPVPVRVTLRCYGPRAPRRVRLQLAVDGRVVRTRDLRFAAGGEREVVFHHGFAAAGSHVVTATLLGARDALRADDQRATAVEVQEQVPVLLVDETGTGLGGLGLAALALAPERGERRLFVPTRVSVTEIDRVGLERYRVALLGPVPALGAGAIAALERYVAGGGGLCVCLGPGTDRRSVNRAWARNGDGFLPCPLAEQSSPARPVAPVGCSTAHPALAAFAGDAAAAWKAGRVRTYFSLDERSLPAGSLQRLITLPGDAPLLVERRRGLGRVVLLTTSLDLSWNDLALHAAYVPLVRGLVGYLASEILPPRNLVPGQVLSHLARPGVGQALALGPTGEELDLRPGNWRGRAAFVSGSLAKQGVYLVKELGARRRAVHYALMPAPGESRLEGLPALERERLFAGLHPVVFHDERRLREMLDASQRRPVELWPWFLGAAVLLLFVETCIARAQSGQEAGRGKV